MNLKEIVRTNLIRYRKAADLKQHELCSQSGIPLNTYRGWEQGKAGIPWDSLERVATHLNIPAWRLCVPDHVTEGPLDLEQFITDAPITYQGQPLTDSDRARLLRLIETALDFKERPEEKPKPPTQEEAGQEIPAHVLAAHLEGELTPEAARVVWEIIKELQAKYGPPK